MRAGIGLLALLVTVALMIWLFAMIEIPKAKVGKQMQSQARQYSGRGEDGEAASDSFAADAKFKGPGIESLSVTRVTPGGAMDAYYALRPGDAITAIQGMRLGDTANGDEELAKALVAEAFSKKQTLTVKRKGQTIELPLPAGATVPPLPAAAAAPAQAAAPPDDSKAPPNPLLTPSPAARRPGGLERQLDGIQNAAGSDQK